MKTENTYKGKRPTFPKVPKIPPYESTDLAEVVEVTRLFVSALNDILDCKGATKAQARRILADNMITAKVEQDCVGYVRNLERVIERLDKVVSAASEADRKGAEYLRKLVEWKMLNKMPLTKVERQVRDEMRKENERSAE